MKPLSLKNKLAGNPAGSPQLKISVPVQSSFLPSQIEVADPKATRALISIMDMAAVMGGAASHYGGPAAFAELMSALHGVVFTESQKQNKNWFDLYHVINDAGHCENGIYALKANYGFAGLKFDDLLKFRSLESPLTGHGEAHLFPEGVFLSNGPLGSALPQAQGLAMADALAGTHRVTVTAISDGACMEGEAREAFAAIPGLAKAGKLAPFVMIISDNNTKLSGRIDQDSFSMEPSFASLAAQGWKLVTLSEGHNLEKCTQVIANAIEDARKNPLVPVAIHAKTIKGYGVKKTMESSSGGHGFPLKGPDELPAFLGEIYGSEKMPDVMNQLVQKLISKSKEPKVESGAKPSQPEIKIQHGVSTALIKARKEGLPIVSVCADLAGSTGMAAFRKEFAAEGFDVGVAESNMISAAAGFSKAGYIPVVDTFAQFGVTKGALPLTMASLSEAPMICIFSHTGFQDAADGASHQALTYLAMTASIPDCRIYALSCSDEAEALVYEAAVQFAEIRKAGGVPPTSIFFLGRENFPRSLGATNYKLGQAQILSENLAGKTKKVCLIGSGSMAQMALTASQELGTQNIGSIVINPSAHNHLDLKTFLTAGQKCEWNFVVVEDHQRQGGFAQTLSFELMKLRVPAKLTSLAVDEKFGQSAYNAVDLYQQHGMDAFAIVRAAMELVQ
jgi:transketolase